MMSPLARLALLGLCTALPAGIAHAQERENELERPATDALDAGADRASGSGLVLEAEPDPEREEVARITLRKVSERALFEFDSSDLTTEGRNELDELVTELDRFDDITAIGFFGYTDSVGTDEYNQALSERRAATVAAHVASAYPDARIDIEGRGEQNPVATNGTPEGRRMNRRVEINLVVADETAIE